MYSSLYLTCQSNLNCDLYEDNTPSNFRNKISVEQWPSQMEVALIFLDASFNKKTPYNIVRVNLHNIIPQENGIVQSDCCIYMMKTNMSLPHRIMQPVYYPMLTDNLSSFHISIEDDKGTNIQVETYETTIQVVLADEEGLNIPVQTVDQISKPVTCVFHLRPMSFLQQKLLRTASNANIAIFPSNEPFCYKNQISSLFHEFNDYTEWEIALESVFIDSRAHRKVREATTMLISVDIIKEQMSSNEKNNVIDRIPCKYTVGNTFSYHPLPHHFVDINARLLDQISISIDFYANDQTFETITWGASQKKKYGVFVNFIIRKKYHH